MRPLLARVSRLQRLAVFEAAARLGSFTAAARELGMTQPGATRHVRALEADLGVVLFDRHPNRIALSVAGRQLLDAVGHGFAAIEATLARLGKTADTFVLAANPGIAQRWLVPHLDGLRQAVGDRELRLWLFDRNAELASGQFDAAIHAGTGEWAGAQARLLFPEIVLPVAAPEYAVRLGLDAATPAAQLAGEDLLHLDDTDRPWMSWRDWFAHQGVALPPQPGPVSYNNYALVLQQAITGNGIALAWRYLIDDLLEQRLLTPVGREVRRASTGYYLIWPGQHHTATVDSVACWLDSLIDR